MAIYLYRTDGLYHPRPDGPSDGANYVAWSVDDLPRLAADIRTTVLALLVYGTPRDIVDTAIVDLLRGAAPDAAPMPAAE